jgi:nitronate monooxygenase/enoyl-[acyl-carrier protein] reductase II
MWDGQVAEWPRYATGAAGPEFEGDLDYAPLWAGESVDVVNDVRPAGEIVRDLVRNAETALAAQGSE